MVFMNSQENLSKVRSVLWIILFLNFGVAAVKIVLGTLIRSNSMTADGFHSLADGSSNIIGLIGIQLAYRPVDNDHPYGHRKFETLAGLAISGILFALGANVIIEAVRKFNRPSIPVITTESLIALLVTLLINILVSKIEYQKGKELNSQILLSDSLHTRSDIFISLGVLVALGGIKLGLPAWIDPAVSLVVAGFILHAGYEVFSMNRDILVDKAVIEEDRIRKIAMAFDEVLDTHSIRSRGSNNEPYIDMHIMTKPDLSIEESHELIHKIEDRIRGEINQNAQLTVHLEPYTEEPEQNHTG